MDVIINAQHCDDNFTLMLLLVYLILDDPYVLAKMFYDILLMMYTMYMEHLAF